MTERRRAIRAVLAVAEEARGRIATMHCEVDHWGQSHVKGGYWASTPDRIVYCYTLENARAVQKILARMNGWRDRQPGIDRYCTLDKAEGELAHAIAEPERYGADKSAERMRRARAKAKEAGRCIVCRGEREEDRAGRSTCQRCSYEASVCVARMREAI